VFGAPDAVNVAAVANGTFYLAGVQLERGSLATSFDVRSIDVTALVAAQQHTTAAFKNRISNADMAVDRNNNGALITVGSSGQEIITGWKLHYTSGSYVAQRNLDGVQPPVGFNSFLGVRAITPAVTLAPQYVVLEQTIPYGSLLDLRFGTASASPLVLSFRVRSSVAGVYGGALRNAQADVTATRTVPFQFILSAVDTWQMFSVAITGDIHASWLSVSPNTGNLYITFGLYATTSFVSTVIVPFQWGDTNLLSYFSQVNAMGTAGNSFMLTGVQLERTTLTSYYPTSTSFDVRPYGTDLMPTGSADLFNTVSQMSTTSYKNRLANGDFARDTINFGSAATVAFNDQPVMDSWTARITNGAWQTQQNYGSVAAPTGFTSYLGLRAVTAYASPVSTDFFGLRQTLPFGGLSDLAWGTTSAVPVMLSFWVRSSLATGSLLGGSVRNAGLTRSFVFSYTILAANTWQRVSIAIPGDTSSGAWVQLYAANTAMYIDWTLMDGGGSSTSSTGLWLSANYITASGSANLGAIASSTWFIAGAQLERGTLATTFDYRPYDVTTALSSAASTLRMKNRLHNGAFAIDQRNRGQTRTLPAVHPVMLDRWYTHAEAAYQPSWVSVGQNLNNLVPPAGFSTYYGLSINTALVSLTGNDYLAITQSFEFSDINDLGWGTAQAIPVTISFWMRTTRAGTYSGSMRGPGGVRSYAFIWTAAANVWQSFAITVPGDSAVSSSWTASSGQGGDMSVSHFSHAYRRACCFGN
jgi:hypothetical protein